MISVLDTDSSSSWMSKFILSSVLVCFAWLLRNRFKPVTSFDQATQSSISDMPIVLPSPLSTSEKNFLHKLKTGNKNVVIFFGSQTGIAEEFAKCLVREGNQLGLRCMIADPSSYEMYHLADMPTDKVAIFVLATYGEGEPTDNAQSFVDWLLEDIHSTTAFSKLNYTIFGLGNKTYENFNATARIVDRRLRELGATALHTRGEGDDNENLEQDFLTWKDVMFPKLCQFFGITGDRPQITEIERMFVGQELAGNTNDMRVFVGEYGPHISTTHYDLKHPFYAKVCTASKLTHADSDCHCVHIDFDISGSNITYQPGDHLGIYPCTPKYLVEALGQRLAIDLDRVFQLTSSDPTSSETVHFPTPCTYRTAFTYYLDIVSPLRTHILRFLASHAETTLDRASLLALSASTERHSRDIVVERRGLLDVLLLFPSVKLNDVFTLIELLPRLQCRYYSIASFQKANAASTISICASVVRYTTPQSRSIEGICSNYLYKLTDAPKMSIPIFVRHSSFKLPKNGTRPVIMIGPGTGIAPFRGMIQEKAEAKRQGKKVGPVLLFFGCRTEKEHLYKEEMEEYVKEGILEMYVAYSRIQKEKVYVQHLMKQQAEKITNLLCEEKGHLYVCGDGKHMSKDVQKALCEILEESGRVKQDVKMFVKELRKSGKYAEDVWG